MFAQVKLMMAGKYEEFHRKLGAQQNLENRVMTALRALEYILPLDVHCDRKDSQISNELRQHADRLFFAKKGNLQALLSAWELYSKSVAFAKSGSQELALAYANRSAILYNLRKYTECIRDIDKALKLHYPDSLRANLLRRKVKCLRLLGKPEVEDVCEEAQKWLKNMDLNDENKKMLEEKIQTAKKTSEIPNIRDSNRRIPVPSFESNNKIPCASDAVDIKYDEKYGRHIVATRDINVGEIIAVEKPYTSLLRPERIYTHCSHCFIRAWDSIPCPNCVHAMYCSEKCKKDAWKQYHDIECPTKGYCLSLAMNDHTPFSLKLTIMAIREAGGFEKLQQQLEEFKKNEDCLQKGFSEDGTYRSDSYKPLYYLETHEDKRWPPEFITMTLNMSVILYFVFTETTFFGKSSDKSLQALLTNKNAIFTANLIAFHYMIVQTNDHELSEVTHYGQHMGLGAVIYPFCSLFNHSCYPNVSRIPILGSDNVMYQMMMVQHTIKKGSQIFDDYGFDFTLENAARRKDLCQKYHFECRCKACRNNWPMFDKLPSVIMTCTSQTKKNDIVTAMTRVAKVEKVIMDGDIATLDAEHETVFKILTDAVNFLSNYGTSPPTKEYLRTVTLLKTAYLVIYGNRINL